jgi:hypothetical protein
MTARFWSSNRGFSTPPPDDSVLLEEQLRILNTLSASEGVEQPRIMTVILRKAPLRKLLVHKSLGATEGPCLHEEET